MYKPKYIKYFLDEIKQEVIIPGFGGDEYNQWVHKNVYTEAIHTILYSWGWPLVYPLIDRGIIQANADDSLEWKMENLDSLARLFHDWPLALAPYEHIPGGFWCPVETAFKVRRGSLRSLVSTNGRYYDRINPEYQKVIAALSDELGHEWLELWNPKVKKA